MSSAPPPWTDDEFRELLAARDFLITSGAPSCFDGKDWRAVQVVMGTRRSPCAVYTKYQRMMKREHPGPRCHRCTACVLGGDMHFMHDKVFCSEGCRQHTFKDVNAEEHDDAYWRLLPAPEVVQ